MDNQKHQQQNPGDQQRNQQRENEPQRNQPGQGQGQGQGGQNKDINKELQLATQNWGSLPPQERQKIVEQITRDYPAKYKPLIDDYFKSLNRAHGFPNK